MDDLISKQPTHNNDSNVLDALDCVSRQAVIDAIEFGITYAKAINKETGEVRELFRASNDELRKAVDRIKALPSAIVQCWECTDWQTDWDPRIAPNTHYCATMDAFMKAEDYCSQGNRREDEDADDK